MNQTNKSILRKSKVEKKKKNICRIGNSKYEDWLFNWEKMKKKNDSFINRESSFCIK